MRAADIHAECWDAIGAVVCINLDRREDRWISFCHGVQGVIPSEKIYRESAVVGAELPGSGEPPWFTERTADRGAYWTGLAGCTLSHRNVIRRAQREGWRNVLIFEDDVEINFTADSLVLLHDALLHFAGSKYLLYLSVNGRSTCARQIARRGECSLLQIGGALSSCAYIVPSDMYAPLLGSMPQGESDVWQWIAMHRATDTFYCDEVELWSDVSLYAVMPQVCRQLDFSSDILTRGKYTLRDIRVRVLPGWLYALYRFVRFPYFFLKQRLNSWRTLRRARRGGFPGYRRKSLTLLSLSLAVLSSGIFHFLS